MTQIKEWYTDFKNETPKTDVKFGDFIKTNKTDIIDVLKWPEALNVMTELAGEYPTEKTLEETIGKILTNDDRDTIMTNIITLSGIKWEKEDLDKFEALVDEYKWLFFPAEWTSVSAKDKSFFDTADKFMELLNLPNTKGFLNFKKNLEEKFNEEY